MRLFITTPFSSIKDNAWLALFYLLLFIYVLSVPVSGVVGWLGYPIGYHLFKFSFVLNFIFLLLFFAAKGSGNSYWFLMFLVSAVLSLVVSIYSGNLELSFFMSHVYFYMIASIGVAAGGRFYTYYGLKFIEADFFYKSAIGVLFIFFVFYYMLYVYGYIPYWGLSSVLPLLLPYFLINKRYFLIFLTLIIVVLSGKRSILLITLVQFFLYYLFFGNVRWVRVFMPISLLVLIVSLWFMYPNLFVRFGVFFDSDIGMSERVALMSSGRSDEILIFWDYFSNNHKTLVFGDGLGANLSVEYFNGNVKVLHYSHFSPFGLLLVGGIPLLITCYGPMVLLGVRLAYRSIIKKEKHIIWAALILLYFIVVSLLGPAMFNDIICFSFLIIDNILVFPWFYT